MKGGSFTFVTKKPLKAPDATPRSNPMMKERTGGTPFLKVSVAITIATKTVIAPQERSIPAVRIIIV